METSHPGEPHAAQTDGFNPWCHLYRGADSVVSMSLT